MAILQNTAFATVKNLTKPNIKRELLEKTRVLKSALLARLKSQFLPSATATLATFATVAPLQANNSKALGGNTELPLIGGNSDLLRKVKVKHCHTKNSTTVLLVSLLATCQPSYANNVKVQQRVNTNNSKVYIRVNSKSEDFSQLEKINQLSFFDSFNCIDKVAVNGNNLKQELRKLLKPVQYHHTLVDVFLCLSFASCLFTGELRLAALWRGGHGNKPVMGEYRVPLGFSGFRTSLPPYFLGQSSKHLPFEKV